MTDGAAVSWMGSWPPRSSFPGRCLVDRQSVATQDLDELPRTDNGTRYWGHPIPGGRSPLSWIGPASHRRSYSPGHWRTAFEVGPASARRPMSPGEGQRDQVVDLHQAPTFSPRMRRWWRWCKDRRVPAATACGHRAVVIREMSTRSRVRMSSRVLHPVVPAGCGVVVIPRLTECRTPVIVSAYPLCGTVMPARTSALAGPPAAAALTAGPPPALVSTCAATMTASDAVAASHQQMAALHAYPDSRSDRCR